MRRMLFGRFGNSSPNQVLAVLPLLGFSGRHRTRMAAILGSGNDLILYQAIPTDEAMPGPTISEAFSLWQPMVGHTLMLVMDHDLAPEDLFDRWTTGFNGLVRASIHLDPGGHEMLPPSDHATVPPGAHLTHRNHRSDGPTALEPSGIGTELVTEIMSRRASDYLGRRPFLLVHVLSAEHRLLHAQLGRLLQRRLQRTVDSRPVGAHSLLCVAFEEPPTAREVLPFRRLCRWADLATMTETPVYAVELGHPTVVNAMTALQSEPWVVTGRPITGLGVLRK